MNGRSLARALFALLVVATVAAFFVAQRIKHSTPVIEKVRFTKFFSPNSDGVRDHAGLRFRLKRTDHVDVEIVNGDGDVIRRVAGNRRLCGPCTHRFRWDGRTADGTVSRDGTYFLRVTLRSQARQVTSPRKLHLDTTPPRPTIRAVSPGAISPDGDGRHDSALVLYEGPAGEVGGAAAPEFVVFRTGLRTARAVARFKGREGSRRARWDGHDGAGRPVPPGNYLISVRVRDAAGNLGAGPALRPRRGDGGGHPGIRVRYLAAKGPDGAVQGGTRAAFRVDTDRDRYHWAVRRLGSPAPQRSGTSSSRGRVPLRPLLPGRPGVYLLELAAGSHTYRTPFAVRARTSRPLLVVIGTLGWQASNLLDADEDGWGETLATDPRVSRRRLIGGSGMPRGVASQVLPVMLALDRDRASYDVTTDLALADGRGPEPDGYRGVLLVGNHDRVDRRVARRLRGYVRGGGRIGWLEPDALHRIVEVEGRRIASRGSRRDSDPFGERTNLERVPPGALEIGRDRIGFFSEVVPAFGSFGGIERELVAAPGSTLLAGAGPASGGLATPVYRLGHGVVARIDPDGIAARLGSDDAVRRLFARLVALLRH